MKIGDYISVAKRRTRVAAEKGRAFSLIEIMVVMGLMSIMVLGLMAMLNQVQRAFKLGMAQTEVMEGGRIATDMIMRELEQMSPTYLRNASPSFYVEMMNLPGLQPLPPGNISRTNIIDDLFFLSRENRTWNGVGYFVRGDPDLAGTAGMIGTLYRFETNNHATQFQQNPLALVTRFNDVRNPALTNYLRDAGVSRVLDGVVHFRVRALDSWGTWILGANFPPQYWWRTNRIMSVPPPIGLGVGDVTRYMFLSNAVPAFVEVELAVLEQQAWERYKSIPIPAAKAEYLRNQAGRIHVFRQRTAIRNVDRSAYEQP